MMQPPPPWPQQAAARWKGQLQVWLAAARQKLGLEQGACPLPLVSLAVQSRQGLLQLVPAASRGLMVPSRLQGNCHRPSPAAASRGRCSTQQLRQEGVPAAAKQLQQAGQLCLRPPRSAQQQLLLQQQHLALPSLPPALPPPEAGAVVAQQRVAAGEPASPRPRPGSRGKQLQLQLQQQQRRLGLRRLRQLPQQQVVKRRMRRRSCPLLLPRSSAPCHAPVATQPARSHSHRRPWVVLQLLRLPRLGLQLEGVASQVLGAASLPGAALQRQLGVEHVPGPGAWCLLLHHVCTALWWYPPLGV
jgi:hypothetical protein